MSIAVIKTGGKQYKVKVGDKIKIEKIKDQSSKTKNPDQKLEFDDILGGKKVKAEVKGIGKGKKIRVFKFRPKKRYKRTYGHRQQYTELEIKEIK